MKKRTLALLLTAVMLFVLTCGMLTACDNSGESSGTGESSQPETSESAPPESQPVESVPLEGSLMESVQPHQGRIAKAVLADMTDKEVCDYLYDYLLHVRERFTDPNTLDPVELLSIVYDKNLAEWKKKDSGKQLTYDELVEELQHYFDIDPDKMNLWETLKASYLSQFYDEEADAFVFESSWGGNTSWSVQIVPLEDRWEGDRRVITFRVDSLSQLVKPELKYSEVFTLEQNGDYVRYVSYERIPIE